MKIARLSHPDGPHFAVLNEETGNYHLIQGDPLYAGVQPSGEVYSAGDARLVAPMLPRSKALGLMVGHDWVVGEEQDLPALAMKPNTAVAGPGAALAVPRGSKRAIVRPALVAVIARPGRDVPVSRVKELVFGYTLGLEIFDGDAAAHPGSVQAAGFDASLGLGPVMETKFGEPEAISGTFVVGDRVTEIDLENPIAQISELISGASALTSFLPGDLVMLPIAAEASVATNGTHVSVKLEGIGTLTADVMLG